MKDFLLSGDTFKIENGDFSFTPDLASFVAQEIKIMLSTAEEEWYLDSTNGIDWFNTVFVKGQNLDVIATHMKAKIYARENVESIEQFEIEFDNATRGVTIFLRVTVSDGSQAEVEVTA